MALTIMGINFGHDGAVTIVRDKRILSHVTTERITRFKKERGVTQKVLKSVLDQCNLSLKDIDIVAVSNWFWDRGTDGIELFNKFKNGFSITKEEGIELSVKDYYQLSQSGNVASGVYHLHIENTTIPCFIMDHHFCHSAYSFFTSPYKEAFTFSLDVNDNLGHNHSSFYFAEDGSYRMIRRDGSFGVGGFYSQVCDFLGFYPSLTDAGKVMALASYKKVGERDYKDGVAWSQTLRDIVWPNNVQMGNIFHGDQFAHLLSLHGIKRFPDMRNFFPQLKGEGGKPDRNWLNKKNWESDQSKEIAADAQWILEESVLNYLNTLDETQNITQNLCVAGGTFLNCVMNGRIQHETNWNVWASPACGDDGLSIGGALFLSHKLRKENGQIIGNELKFAKPKFSHKQNIEGGKKYSRKHIKTVVENSGLAFSEPENLPFKVAQLISDNSIVAWFQGGSEIGPRSLGQRSILANPINKDMKDILNERVKHREGFRPFAPMVLLDDVGDWFDVPISKSKESPFMLFSYKCKHPNKIPSGVHVDGTARIQTVDEENNKRIYDVITEFKRITGIPIIINTSFNVMGEPIVESPEDAIKCFKGTDIDYLVIDNLIVRKK